MQASSSRKMSLCLSLVTIMAVALLGAEGRQPVLHRVGGGKYTWAPNINYTKWASHEHFFVGDWVYFGFDKKRYNVLEVNKTNYSNCIDKNFITNITRGRRDVFNLKVAKTYYFLCGRGYCSKGMKLEVNAQFAPPDSLPPMVIYGGSSTSSTALELFHHVTLLVSSLVLSHLTLYFTPV